MKKLLNVISTIFCTLLVIIMIACAVCFARSIKFHITMSGSMEPNIHTGSVCFVDTKANYEDIVVNDVIAFKVKSGAYVTHRAIAITDEGIETKGDNNDVSDGISTTADNFYGKTLFSIPYIGYAIIHLKEPYGKIIIAILSVTIIAFNIIDSIESKKDKKDKKDIK